MTVSSYIQRDNPRLRRFYIDTGYSHIDDLERGRWSASRFEKRVG